MKITGTLIWYYYICPREVWLMSHEVSPFQDDSFLEIGRLIHEDSFGREKKEISAGNMKFDIVKKGDNKFIVAEIKKTSRFLKSAKMQLGFYLYNLEKQGIKCDGELLIPKEKKRIKIKLNDELREELTNAINEIKKIITKDLPPPPTKNKYCRNCAYREFCYA